MGLPVIATNWSGPTAFLDEHVGYPVAIDGLVTVPEGVGPFGGHKWAQPSVAHLRQRMREVWGDREEAARRGLAARKRMVQRYSPHMLARQVVERLHQIEAEGGRRGRR